MKTDSKRKLLYYPVYYGLCIANGVVIEKLGFSWWWFLLLLTPFLMILARWLSCKVYPIEREAQK